MMGNTRLAARGFCGHIKRAVTGGPFMSTFDDRERAYEAKFAHDADLRFKAEARRNRLLGEWAAGLLGKEGEDIRSYAMTVVTADFQSPGDEDVFRKIA